MRSDGARAADGDAALPVSLVSDAAGTTTATMDPGLREATSWCDVSDGGTASIAPAGVPTDGD
jgi:hypothetical protein